MATRPNRHRRDRHFRHGAVSNVFRTWPRLDERATHARNRCRVSRAALRPGERRPIRLRRLRRVAWLLDRAVPIGGFRVGLDPIIGLIPGLGDSIGALLSLYVLYEGARFGAPGYILVRMTGNILIEAILGAVPVLGDVFDFVWQANTRNLRLIQKYHNPGWQPRSMQTVWISVAIAAAVVLTVVVFLAWSVFNALIDLAHRA